ncbi:hypothetical protein EDC31_14115, partial [Acidomonas methanolica]
FPDLRRKSLAHHVHHGSFSQIGASGKPGTLQSDQPPLRTDFSDRDNQSLLWRMGQRIRRRQDDHGAARPPDPSLRHRRDRQRKLAVQKPLLTPAKRIILTGLLPCAYGSRKKPCHVWRRGHFCVPIGGQIWFIRTLRAGGDCTAAVDLGKAEDLPLIWISRPCPPFVLLISPRPCRLVVRSLWPTVCRSRRNPVLMEQPVPIVARYRIGFTAITFASSPICRRMDVVFPCR